MSNQPTVDFDSELFRLLWSKFSKHTVGGKPTIHEFGDQNPPCLGHRETKPVHDTKVNQVIHSTKTSSSGRERGNFPNKQLSSVHTLRGAAALAVVFYHTHVILGRADYGSVSLGWADSFVSQGWIGVNVFFIISGFIIMFAHSDDVGQPAHLWRYFTNRFIRLYPTYWIALGLFLASTAVGFGRIDFSWNSLNIISSVLLVRLTDNLSLPLKVAWTLVYEVNFYVFFAVLIANRRYGAGLFLIWFVGIVGNAAFGGKYTFLSLWNLYFFAGMISYFAYIYCQLRAGLVAAGLGILFGAFAIWYGMNHELSEEFATPTSILIILAPVFLLFNSMLQLDKYGYWFRSRSFDIVADASYSLYLVHSAAISAFAIISMKLGIDWAKAPFTAFAFSSSLAIVCGVCFHFCVERPLLRKLRERLTSFTSLSRAPTTSS